MTPSFRKLRNEQSPPAGLIGATQLVEMITSRCITCAFGTDVEQLPELLRCCHKELLRGPSENNYLRRAIQDSYRMNVQLRTFSVPNHADRTTHTTFVTAEFEFYKKSGVGELVLYAHFELQTGTCNITMSSRG